MIFNFFDLVQIRFDEPLGTASAYFRRELGVFLSDREARSKYVIEFRPLASHAGPSAGFDASVGNMMFRCAGRFYIGDGSGAYAEWIQPQDGQDRLLLYIDPHFKPYRAYYYIVLPLLKLFLNRHGLTFIHSSAVELDDQRIALGGWGGTGKTNTLLRLIESGAIYLSDDLTVVDENGGLYPFPRSVNVYHYNLEGVPSLAQKMTAGQRVRARAASIAGALALGILPRYRHYITIGQKKLSGTSIPSPMVNRGAQSAAGKAAAAFIMLYSGGSGDSGAVGPPLSADEIAGACLANIMYEFQSIQALYSMYAFLSGSTPVMMVNDVDYKIVRSFLANTRAGTMMVPPDGSVKTADILRCTARTDG